MNYSTVAEMTIDELEVLIKETFKQSFLELIADPDEGLEIREEIKSKLQQSLAKFEDGGDTIPAGEVAAKLGLDW